MIVMVVGEGSGSGNSVCVLQLDKKMLFSLSVQTVRILKRAGQMKVIFTFVEVLKNTRISNEI